MSKKKIELNGSIDLEATLMKVKSLYSSEKINEADGIRIDFDKEWVHLRQSNTEPIIRIYAESNTAVCANDLADKLIKDIKRLDYFKKGYFYNAVSFRIG